MQVCYQKTPELLNLMFIWFVSCQTRDVNQSSSYGWNLFLVGIFRGGGAYPAGIIKSEELITYPKKIKLLVGNIIKVDFCVWNLSPIWIAGGILVKVNWCV